jgi:tetratricopeptide (TPR) repeat protein
VNAGRSKAPHHKSRRLLWLSGCLIGLSAAAVVVTAATSMMVGPRTSANAPSAGPTALPTWPTTDGPLTAEELRSHANAVKRELVGSYPTSARAYHIAASYEGRIRQYEQAIALWMKALELDPDLVVARTSCAAALLEQGKPDEARAVLIGEQSGAADAKATVYGCLLLIQSWEQSGDVVEAGRVADESLSRFPDNPVLLLEKGRLRLVTSQLDDAHACFLKVIEITSEVSEAYRLLAMVSARMGKNDEQETWQALFEQQASSRSDSSERFQARYRNALQEIVGDLLVLAAAEHAQQGAALRSRQLLLEAIALEPSDQDAYQSLVTSLVNAGDFSEAYRFQKELVQHAASSVNLQNLASLAMRAGDLDGAEDALGSASLVEPDSVLILESLFLVRQRRGDLRGSLQIAEKLAVVEPTRERYQFLAQLYRQAGDEAGYRSAVAVSADLGRKDRPRPDSR